MGFATALSGLNAASNNLAVTGNNIANANTVGFKKSRSEFADVYATSLGGVSNTTPGSGVRVANVAQQFNQGNLQFTDNNLDLAISGEGFFVLGKSPLETTDLSYSRAGEFKLNQEGFVVNNQGKALLAYKPNGDLVTDGFSTGVTQPVQIQTTSGTPTSTSNVALKVNLNAEDKVITYAGNTPPTFDPTNSETFNNQTSLTIYDSLGAPHTLTTYFQKASESSAGNTWNVFYTIDSVSIDTTAGTPETITFDASGNLSNYSPKTDLSPYVITPPTGASDIQIARLDLTESTQLQSKFGVNAITQNGKTVGRLTGVSIDDEGVIFARFSNGNSEPMGKVAMARFANPGGLNKIGDTVWTESGNSGAAVLGEAGGNSLGTIKSGALESSNVELSMQLVNLIVAQQHYQANAQTITTENSIMQTILNIR